MGAAEGQFDSTVSALFHGMEEFITTKTVVGDPVHVGDTILLPMVDVSFGMMASAKAETQKRNAGGGMGGKLSPTAVLVIQNGGVYVVNIKNQDAVSKVIDAAPALINRFMSGIRPNPGVKEAEEDVRDQEETF